MSILVRRVRADEWERVRDLRLDALRDPDAAIAFLSDYETEVARPEEYWQCRAADGAEGEQNALFIAESGGDWIGTVRVVRLSPGAADIHGREAVAPRADIVGVYVRRDRRGEGVIEALFEAAVSWAGSLGDREVTLDVHVENARAQAVYRRLGFVDTGHRFSASIGPELEMRRALA